MAIRAHPNLVQTGLEQTGLEQTGLVIDATENDGWSPEQVTDRP